MAAMYRSSPRLLLLYRQSCHVGQSYLEVSKCKASNLQLVVDRYLSDSLKHKSTLNFDINKLDLDDSVKDVPEKKSVVTDNVKIKKEVKKDSSKISHEEIKEEGSNVLKQESISEEKQKSGVEEKQKSSLGDIDKRLVHKKNARLAKNKFDNTIGDLTSREKMLKNLYETLKNSSQINEVSHAIEVTLKRLETLNSSQLTEEECAPIATFLDERYRLGKLPNRNFEQILSFFVKNNKKDSQITFDLLHEACWRFRKEPLEFVAAILASVKKNCTTPKRQEVVTEAENRIMGNIGGIASPKLMLSVMYVLLSDSRFQQRIEEEVSMMLHTMDPVQTYKLLYLLATHKSKNIALIRKAKVHLLSRPLALSFSLENLTKLFFACDTLRIHDSTLLQEMSMNTVDCLSKRRDVNIMDVVAILNHCSRIGWNNTDLTESIMNVIQNGTINCTKRHQRISLAYLVLCLGHMNLLQYCDFGGQLAGRLQSLKEEKPSLWLDVVHSLACLKTAETNDVKTLLSEDFYQPLLDSVKDKPEYLQGNYMRKLLSLHGYLKVDLNEPTWESDTVASEWKKSLQDKSSRKPVRLSKHVGEVLADFAPLEKYTNTNVVTQFGSNIEFELFVDETGKAVTIEESKGKERIWIKVLEINDFVRGSGLPTHTGNTAMTIRHLNDEKNVHTIYVSYVEWNTLETKEEQLRFLESKIKAAVCSEEETAV